MNRFRRLGLQKRIMAYVTVGLALMFGAVAFLGLGAIDQAAQLVYQERLSTAHTTAAILERDLARVASDTAEIARVLPATPPPGSSGLGPARRTRDELSGTGTYPFFKVSGLWLLDVTGAPVDESGDPHNTSPARADVVALLQGQPDGGFVVLRAMGQVPDAVPLASVAIRISTAAAPAARFAVVHLVSVNSGSPYVPALYGQPASKTPPAALPSGANEEYHLEVVAPDGTTLLGIGTDERPGQMSPHYHAIKGLVAAGGAATLLHEPGSADRFEPHVMAVVPLGASPFYVVLEQPVDVALALPLQLRDRLLLTIAGGFVAALVVAWITTRHVVKSTEQLTVAAERMARGDLASPVDVSAEDEIGQLAESLEAMRGHLRDAYAAVERTNRELESRVVERTARLGQVLRKTITAQEEERRRLARELHDESAQTLAALSIALDRARDSLDRAGGMRATGSGDALGRIQEAREIASRLLAETRRMILGLRPSALDDLGLVPAIRWHCEQYLGDRVEVSIEADPPGVRLPGHIELTLFRVIQEAVSNIARHAQARHVRIAIGLVDRTVSVAIVDDGRGFDVERAFGAAPTASESVGLIGMRERIALLNGRMEVRSTPGTGTAISVVVPVVAEAA